MFLSQLIRLLRPGRRSVRRSTVRLALERIEDRITPVTTVSILDAPATGSEGTEIKLNSSTDAATPVYTWSVVKTKDGVSTPFATGTGANFSFTPDDDGSYAVTLNASDTDAVTQTTTTATASATIAVINVPPTASLIAPSVGVRGQTLSFTLDATDPSTVDTAAGFTFKIDWTGDGTVVETFTNKPSGTVVTHTFADDSTNTVKLTATDKDGGVSKEVTQVVTIKAVALEDDLLTGKKLLAVGGTTGNDNIVLNPSHGVKVLINGVSQGNFS